MAQQTLTFSAEGRKYKASYTSRGRSVAELERTAPGCLEIRAYLDGMTPLTIAKDYLGTPQNLIFQLDIPEGVKVDIISDTAVTAAALLDGAEAGGSV